LRNRVLFQEAVHELLALIKLMVVYQTISPSFVLLVQSSDPDSLGSKQDRSGRARDGAKEEKSTWKISRVSPTAMSVHLSHS
jgi:hypothetical protein